VPDLAPFRGLRYTRGPDLSRVTAPPYDVIDPAEHEELEASDEHNAVRLILPRPSEHGDPYENAAATLAAWRRKGVLRCDAEPSYYAYRMVASVDDGRVHTTVGVIGALAIPDGDPAAAGILPHERTLPKARSDRLALLRATRANLDPIWGLSLADGLTELLKTFEPVAYAIDAQGVRHEIGILTDARATSRLRELVRAHDLVLADGHHRFETACNYRRETSDRPGCGGIMCFVVELDDTQLDVRPFHRIVEQAPADLRERLAGSFAVRDAGPVTRETVTAVLHEMDATGAMGLVDHIGVAILDPKLEALEDALADEPDCLHAVDAARFDAAVRPHLDGAPLHYRGGIDAVLDLGPSAAAVLLRGVAVEQIRAAADERVLMPEKTTYFAPKPRTGMVFRCFDD